MMIEAVYFDGETARDRAVNLRRVDNDLEFVGADTPLTRWSIKGLHPIDPPTPGQPFRITHDHKPGARLVIRDESFIKELIGQNKHLAGGYGWHHIGQVLGWTVAGLAGAAALTYVALTVLPHQVAKLLPDSWRNRVGEQVLHSVVGTAKRCQSTPIIRSLRQSIKTVPEIDRSASPPKKITDAASPRAIRCRSAQSAMPHWLG